MASPVPAATFESRSHVEATGTGYGEPRPCPLICAQRGDRSTLYVFEFYTSIIHITCLRVVRSWALGSRGRVAAQAVGEGEQVAAILHIHVHNEPTVRGVYVLN